MQTTTTLAAEFGTTPRTLRKFLRSDASGIESVGKGARYSLPTAKREINSLRKRFDAWSETAIKKANDAPEAPAEEAIDADAPISLDELEGPSDDELLALDD